MAAVSPAPAPILSPWTAYRTWAATARFQKKSLEFWQRLSLLLAIAGAILAAVGQQILPWAPKEDSGLLYWLFKTPTLAGGAATALAAYFTQQMLGGEREKIWIKARSAAESCKAALFLYRAGVPPFDGSGAETALIGRIHDIEKAVTDIPARTPTNDGEPNLSRLTVSSYQTERIDDQINFYRSRAGDYQKIGDRLSYILFGLGAISVVLAVASTSVATWIAVIATLTTALTAYSQNQRYLGMVVLYQATARRLEELKDEWAVSGKTDEDRADRNNFIQRCEDTLAVESGAWVTQWTSQKPGQNAAASTNNG